MRAFHCPYLRGEVELTDEREDHITQTHPDLPEYLAQVEQTLADPDLFGAVFASVRRFCSTAGSAMFAEVSM